MQDTHLHHHEEHLKNSDLLGDIVIGMSDGLTVPFALAAGLSGVTSNLQNGTYIIVIAGIAEIAAGSIAMGLGGYLAGKTEQDHYNSELKREYLEIEIKREFEIKEVKEVFAEWGLSEEIQNKATQEIIQDKNKWVRFMMKHELHLDEPDPKRAGKRALNIGISYIAGGLVPLSPYFFIKNSLEALEISALMTLICLFIFGYFKSKLTGVSPLKGGFKVMIIGAVAATAAFIIAKLIGG